MPKYPDTVSELERRLIAEVIAREGGYVNRATDRGGETMYGITVAVARANGYQGAMRDLPVELAATIYSKRYWSGPGFEQIAYLDPDTACYLFDWGVNSGPATAIKSLQSYLNVMNNRGRLYPDMGEPDGGLGPVTMGTLQKYLNARGKNAWRNLRADVNASRLVFCRNLAERREEQEEYAWGWYNRILDLITNTKSATPIPSSWMSEVLTE